MNRVYHSRYRRVVGAYAYEMVLELGLGDGVGDEIPWKGHLSVDELLDVAEPADVVLLLLELRVRDDKVGQAGVDAALGEVRLERVLDDRVEGVELWVLAGASELWAVGRA